MIKNLKRREALKTMAAVGGLLMLRDISIAGSLNKNERLATGWSYEGRPCIIYQQGSILLLINEVGSVASGVWTGDNTFVVLSGNGWDIGLTAQVLNRGNTIAWSNNTIWTLGPAPKAVLNLAGGWFYQGQPCAIFQQGMILVLVNELGSIGTGLWTVSNSFLVIGGSGWDAGLVAQVADRGQTVNWSNNTIWTRS